MADNLEILYLITKYLKEYQPVAEIGNILEEHLESKLLLGKIFSWNGKCRDASTDDWRRKLMKVNSDQLVKHLQKSILKRGQENIWHPPSLLYPEWQYSHKNKVDSCISWLQSRVLGLNKFGTKNRLGVGLGYRTSTKVTNHLQYNYKLLWMVGAHLQSPAYCSIFDNTGKYAITGADDFLVKIWDVEKGQLLRTCRGHKGFIVFIAISSDNSLMASACYNGSIRIWRFSDGVCLKVFAHTGIVNWLKFDPLNCSLISAGDDGYCTVWDLSILLPFDGHDYPLLDILAEEKKIKTSQLILPSITSSSSSHIITRRTKELQQSTFASYNTDTLTSSTINTSDSLNSEMNDPLFDDTDNPVINGKLQLPHIRDSLQLEDEDSSTTLKVVSLDISPGGGLIVTGCDDGVARLWRYFDASASTTAIGGIPPFKLHRQMDPNLQILRGLVSPHEWRKMETVATNLLCRLEGHLSAVSDTIFSNNGDRILTGSMEDGAVRVWCFGKDYFTHEHIVLSMNQDNSQDLTQNLRGRSRGMRPASTRNKLYCVNWTCDDQRIITCQSVAISIAIAGGTVNPTRLKVWDSYTGQLLVTINEISIRRSSLLAVHPFDPNICVTAGDDGCINVWDIESGTTVVSHTSLAPPNIPRLAEGTPLEIGDVNFSPDGHFLIAGDSLGRIIYLGIDDGSRYADLYPEQYFSTDYSEVMFDAEDFAIDVSTQLPVHEAPRGMLVKMNGNPYPIQPNKLSDPKPLPAEQVKQDLHEKREFAFKTLDKLRERSFATCQRLQRRSKGFQSTSSSLSNRHESVGRSSSMTTSNIRTLNDLTRSSANNSSSSNRRSTQSVMTTSSHEDGRYLEDDHDVHNESDSEESDYGTRTGRRLGGSSGGGGSRYGIPNYDNLTQSERKYYRQNNVGLLRFSNSDVNRMRAEREARLRRRRVVHEGKYDEEDDEESAEGEDSEGDHLSQSLDIEDDDDDDDDDARVEPLHRRRLVRRSRRDQNKHNHNHSHSQSQSHSQTQRATSKRSGRSSASNRKSHTAAIEDTSHEEGINENEEEMDFERPVLKLKRSWSRYKGKHTITEDAVVDRSWLSADSLQPHTYCPQVGDVVYYLPQGHSAHLQEFAVSQAPPWRSFPSPWPVVECKVDQLRYQFPTATEHRRCDSIVVLITLTVTGIPSRWKQPHPSPLPPDFIPPTRGTRSSQSQSKNLTFTVALRKCELPEFLIPSYEYIPSMRLTLRVPMNVCSDYIIDVNENKEYILKTYTGQFITYCENDPTVWPDSPWNCVEVLFPAEREGEEHPVERLSPWDVYPLDHPRNTQQHMSKINNEIKQKVLTKIRELRQENSYEIFFSAVDLTVFRDYHCIVPLPIDLSLIERRLENDYYRQLEALESDIELLYDNCVLYNDDESTIVFNAKILCHLLIDTLHGKDVDLQHQDTSSRMTSDEMIDHLQHEEDFVLKLNFSKSQNNNNNNINNAEEKVDEKNDNSQHQHKNNRYNDITLLEDHNTLRLSTRQSTSSSNHNNSESKEEVEKGEEDTSEASDMDENSEQEEHEEFTQEKHTLKLKLRRQPLSHSNQNLNDNNTNDTISENNVSVKSTSKDNGDSRVSGGGIRRSSRQPSKKKYPDDDYEYSTATTAAAAAAPSTSTSYNTTSNYNHYVHRPTTSTTTTTRSTRSRHGLASPSSPDQDEDTIHQNQASSTTNTTTTTSSSRRSNRPKAAIKYFEDENEDTCNDSEADTALSVRKQPRRSNDTPLEQQPAHPQHDNNPTKDIVITTRSGRQRKLNRNYYSDNSDNNDCSISNDNKTQISIIDTIKVEVSNSSNTESRRSSRSKNTSLLSDNNDEVRRRSSLSRSARNTISKTTTNNNIDGEVDVEDNEVGSAAAAVLNQLPTRTTRSKSTSNSSHTNTKKRPRYQENSDSNSSSSSNNDSDQKNIEDKDEVEKVRYNSNSNKRNTSRMTTRRTSRVSVTMPTKHIDSDSSDDSDNQKDDVDEEREKEKYHSDENKHESEDNNNDNDNDNDDYDEKYHKASNNSINTRQYSTRRNSSISTRNSSSSLTPANECRMRDLLALIEKADAAAGGIFSVPVTEEEAPNYFAIVLQPMDLSTIRKKFSKKRYSTIQELCEDILLIYSNCELYNTEESEFSHEAKKQRKMVLKFMNQRIEK